MQNTFDKLTKINYIPLDTAFDKNHSVYVRFVKCTNIRVYYCLYVYTITVTNE